MGTAPDLASLSPIYHTVGRTLSSLHALTCPYPLNTVGLQRYPDSNPQHPGHKFVTKSARLPRPGGTVCNADLESEKITALLNLELLSDSCSTATAITSISPSKAVVKIPRGR
ncbi:hypothetical protein TNCV_492111 [Trichonephila clavipes]|nr:hypothetical protein TNCV_492111 [Trichonephila clavipes]